MLFADGDAFELGAVVLFLRERRLACRELGCTLRAALVAGLFEVFFRHRGHHLLRTAVLLVLDDVLTEREPIIFLLRGRGFRTGRKIRLVADHAADAWVVHVGHGGLLVRSKACRWRAPATRWGSPAQQATTK